MSEFKIVEYSNAYAAAIADMWNRSGESWGGRDMVRTEESILREHENSTMLNIFLAVVGEEVIGYCSFGKYLEDAGALYVALLNVRPDYHGKKVGKALVLKCVERTVELGWPRLDLYTWAGNTKAVPTYKKCGFFWEKRDDRVHLMNFIPTVLQTEALKEYFEYFDWYGDCKRKLILEPDGRKENGFDFYEYSWDKDEHRLRVEFERTGRGIRLIETDDYLISASVHERELVFGLAYPISYHMVNKSGKPLHVSINGLNDRNIRHDFNTGIEVEGDITVEGGFYLDETDEWQDSMRTCPAVTSELVINGKKAVFKLGLETQFPAALSISLPFTECYKGVESRAFVEIENKFTEAADFVFKLPDTADVSFPVKEFRIGLEGKQKKSLPITYTLRNHCFYSEKIPVQVKLKSGRAITFSKKLEAMFKGRSGAFGGELDYCHFIANGSNIVYLWKASNWSQITRMINFNERAMIANPKLGKPYSTEFQHEKPFRVDKYTDGQNMVMEAVYRSEDFKGVEISSIFRLDPRGLLEHWYKVANISDTVNENDLWVFDGIGDCLYRAVLPYDNRFIELQDQFEKNSDDWDSEKYSENWMFSKGDRVTSGVYWDKSCKMQIRNGQLSFEHNMGRLAPGESKKTPPVFLAYGMFEDWMEFRAFVLGVPRFETIDTDSSFELLPNGGNPFVEEDFQVKVIDNKKRFFNGKLELSSRNGAFCRTAIDFKAADEVREVVFPISMDKKQAIDVVKLDASFEVLEFCKETAVFRLSGEGIWNSMNEARGNTVYSAGNGVLEMKASPEFAPNLYSLAYKGNEWLDTSFPNAGPRSWWNPWTGGIGTLPEGFMTLSVMQEKRDVGFADISDNMGNRWKGLCITVRVNENPRFKGLEYRQYYLMLPGVPVMCHVIEVVNNTGWFFNFTSFETEMFLKCGDDIRGGWLEVVNKDREARRIKTGRAGMGAPTCGSVLCGSGTRDDKLQVYSKNGGASLGGFTNNAVTTCFAGYRVVAGDGESLFTPPVFLIFTPEKLPDNVLKSLDRIRFGP